MENNILLVKKHFLNMLHEFNFDFLTIFSGGEKKDAIAPVNNGVPGFVPASGFGPSLAEPEGRLFELPSGIVLESPSYPCNRLDEADLVARSADIKPAKKTLVPLCLLFKNITTTTIIVKLPAGLIFISESKTVQNGILLETVAIEVPAGESVMAPIKGFCLNEGRAAPGVGTDFKYRVGPVTRYKPMLNIINKLKTKILTSGNEQQDAVINDQLQSLVLEIAHKGKLDVYNLALLDGLSDK